jgi:hypothetical protein
MAMDGLPSALVRLAHVHQSKSFSDKFEKGCNFVASRVRRIPVQNLPPGNTRWLQYNRSPVIQLTLNSGTKLKSANPQDNE